MNKNLFLRIVSPVIFFSLITLNLYGQGTGRISGKVTDSKTGETLIGLTVKIDGTTQGSSTDVEGRYILGNLAPGNYNLIFSYIGFQTKNITEVAVSAGKTTALDVVMEEAASQELMEVVITATARQESVSNLYTQQKNAISISSGIVADQIRRSPDRNTSEVLKRVSGASIQDNKFIVIRGLSDRYNVALINNSILPSSEPDRRAFSFDIVPSNLIDRIVINKTASPDLPGDFAGGVTQIITKDIPDQNFLSFNVTGGYNTQATFKDFISNGRNELDFLGFDNGNRKLPEGFPSSRQRYNAAPLNDQIGFSRLLPNSYPESKTTALPVQSYQVNYGKVKNFKNDGVFGTILSLTYRNAQNFYDATRETFDGVNTSYRFEDDNYRYSTNLGALANFTYKINRSKISLKNLFNQSFEDSYVSRTGFNQNQASNIRLNSSELTQKSLVSSQLEGEHQIGQRNLKAEWNLNYSLIKRQQPDLRSIIYNQPLNTNNPFTLVDDFTRRFYSDLTDNNYGGSASLTIPFQFLKNKSNLKVGALKQYRTRDFDARIFLYDVANFSQFDQTKNILPKEVIFDTENISNDGFVLDEITNNTDSYTGETDLNAGFIMLDNKLSDKLRLSWGGRIESYRQSITALNPSGNRVTFDEIFNDILPSFNLTYNLNEKSNLRLSGSRTVSRPELRELAPFTFINQEENSQITGNPNLLRSQNTNADIRFETYPKSGEAFTVSLFYKYFQNPIEQIIGSTTTPDNIKFEYRNAKEAYSYGFEVDFRKRLDFVAPGTAWLENLIAFANFTYIKSEADLNLPGFDKRELQGQSPYLINAGLQYNSLNNGLTFSALYNKIGERISKVGNNNIGFPSIYERGRDVVDFQVAKRIFKNRAELKLNISDILNQSQVLYQNYNSSGNTYSPADDVEFYQYKVGTNFSLGLTYDFNFKN